MLGIQMIFRDDWANIIMAKFVRQEIGDRLLSCIWKNIRIKKKLNNEKDGGKAGLADCG